MEKNQKTSSTFHIFKNFSFLTTGKLLGDVFTFLLFVYLTRTYGEQGIGDYSFAMGYAGFFVIFADFGLYHFSIREISRKKKFDSLLFKNILTLRLFFCLLIILLLSLSVILFEFSTQTKQVILILGVYLIFVTIIDGFMAVFVAAEKMHVPAIVEFSFKTLIAITCILLSILSSSLVTSLLAFPAIGLLFACISYILVGNFTTLPKLSTKVNELLLLAKKSIEFCISAFLIQLSSRTDVVMLGYLIGTISSGIYNISYRIILLMLWIAFFASISIYPLVTRLYNSSKNSLEEFYSQSINICILFGVPASAGLCLISNQLVELLFGSDFEKSGNVLVCLSWLFIIVLVSNIAGIFLAGTDQQKIKTKCQWYAAITNVVLNFVFIYQWKEVGAAVATVISEFLLLILFSQSLKDLLGIPRFGSRLVISLGGTVLFSSLFIVFKNSSILLLVPLATLIYFIYLMTFKSIRNNELRYITSLFK